MQHLFSLFLKTLRSRHALEMSMGQMSMGNSTIQSPKKPKFMSQKHFSKHHSQNGTDMTYHTLSSQMIQAISTTILNPLVLEPGMMEIIQKSSIGLLITMKRTLTLICRMVLYWLQKSLIRENLKVLRRSTSVSTLNISIFIVRLIQIITKELRVLAHLEGLMPLTSFNTNSCPV